MFFFSKYRNIPDENTRFNTVLPEKCKFSPLSKGWATQLDTKFIKVGNSMK